MSQVVEATADFMASYPSVPPASGQQSDVLTNGDMLWLGPPTDGGEEGNPQNETWNPTCAVHAQRERGRGASVIVIMSARALLT